jgi:hypothetical protein
VFDEQVKCYWKLFHMEHVVRRGKEPHPEGENGSLRLNEIE